MRYVLSVEVTMNTKKTVKLTVSQFFSFALVGASIVLVCLQANFCHGAAQEAMMTYPITSEVVAIPPISYSLGVIFGNVALMSQDVVITMFEALPDVAKCYVKASGEITTAIFRTLPAVAERCAKASKDLCKDATIESKFLVAGLGVYLAWKICKCVKNC